MPTQNSTILQELQYAAWCSNSKVDNLRFKGKFLFRDLKEQSASFFKFAFSNKGASCARGVGGLGNLFTFMCFANSLTVLQYPLNSTADL